MPGIQLNPPPDTMPSCGSPECRLEGCQHDRDGYNRAGYNREGYNRAGYNREGYDRAGYDSTGYNRHGYSLAGYDREGYDRAGYDRDGYDSDGYDSDGDMPRCNCGDCNDDNRDSRSSLEYYSYTPRLQFRGDKGPYYGMEIEVTTDYPGKLVDTVNEHAEPNLIYCKEDSSVEGAEIVTHPMSYDWAMANFPWDILPKLRDDCDATVITQENGIHVHVSRDGFDTPAHLYRWLKFWYRNPNDIQRIARRRNNSWAEFRAGHRRAHVEHVKRHSRPMSGTSYGGPMYYDRDNDNTLSRYSAVNTTNDATLEVRIFASTLRPQRAKAALQLVAGSVEYTRQLRADAVARRHGWDWRAFVDWAGKDGRYNELIAENRIRRGQ